MHTLPIVATAALLLASSPASAQSEAPGRAQPPQQLVEISPADAASLIARLEEAQGLLKAGKFQRFELLSGSIASYPEADIAPKAQFLRIPFRAAWRIERVATSNRAWQPFRIAYAPAGLGQPYWDIEVVVGSDSTFERITLTFKPPAPF